ncbi:MAG: putative dienelactone hydrolase [Bradymonadia bacterium]|jgi:predicted dienelactone hydrolase
MKMMPSWIDRDLPTPRLIAKKTADNPALYWISALVFVCGSALTSCGDIGSESTEPESDATTDAGSNTDQDTVQDTLIDTESDADTAIDTPEDVESDTVESINPAERGSYEVGYLTTELTYDRPDNGEVRTLRTAVWYPTEATEGDQPFYFGVFPRQNVWEDSEPAPVTDAPVLVYSHGHYGYAEASPELVEHFASHGWIVIAPDHTGNTTANNGQPRDTAIYHLRSTDLSAALDWLEALPSDHPLIGMPSDRIIAAGHSYGGYTTLTACGASFSEERLDGCPEDGGDFCSSFDDTQLAIFEAGVRDDRIRAGILMAAGNFGELGAAGVRDVETPLLQLTGGMDLDVTNEANGDPIWAALPEGDHVRVNLPRGCHQTFAVGCGLPGELNTQVGFEIVNTYALAFGLRWAEEILEMDAILSGETVVNADEVELSVK